MLRSVEVASASISLTTCCCVPGRPRCLPRASAALIPAVTRSLMSDDSSERREQMARAPREAIEFPDQHAVDRAVPGGDHQGVEQYALDMSDLPGPLNPQPLPF